MEISRNNVQHIGKILIEDDTIFRNGHDKTNHSVAKY